MTPAALSTSSLVTIGTVFLIVMVMTFAQKAISTIVTALLISVVAVFVIQHYTGTELVNIAELQEFALHWIIQLFNWIMEVFWPMLSEIAKELGA